MTYKADPKLDLFLQRVVDVPSDLVWEAWTRPEHVKVWFTPAPWRTPECEIDLRPGGMFRTVMRGPDGEEHHNMYSYLEVVPGRRLVWTDALLPGWRPAASARFFLTVIVELESLAKDQTRYTATALHRDEAACKEHEAMGFFDGWGAATDQLVAHAKSLM